MQVGQRYPSRATVVGLPRLIGWRQDRPSLTEQRQVAQSFCRAKEGFHGIAELFVAYSTSRGHCGKLDEVSSVHALASVIKQCTKQRALNFGRRTHDHIVRCGLHDCILLFNGLVLMYGNCGHKRDARKVFDGIQNLNRFSWTNLIKAYAVCGALDEAWTTFCKMPYRDVVAWNAMIAAFSKNGHVEKAIDLFAQTVSNGIKPSNVTFVCVLDACANVANLELGRVIHAAIIDSEHNTDVAVGNALISMYGKCKSSYDASKTFMQMTERDVISWSAFTAALVYNELHKNALETFCGMARKNVQPNDITFVSVLEACKNLEALAEGQQLYSYIVECNVEQDLTVGNALVSMFGRCARVLDARCLFSSLHKRNVITWSAIIGACTQNGFFEEALELFLEMQFDKLKPDQIAYVSVLDACANLSAFEEGHLIHTAIVENSFEHYVVLGNALINMYSKCQNLPHAKNVFAKVHKGDVVTWSTMIAAYAQNQQEMEALNLFHLMQLSGIKPNLITFVSLLELCTVLGALEEGQKVHFAVIDMGLDHDVTVGTAFVNMYGKCRSLHDARSAFDAIFQQDVTSWNSMMVVYTDNQHGKEALELFHQMQLDGTEPNMITFICVLGACADLAVLEEGKGIHMSIANSGSITDLLVMNALINLYGRCGELQEAILLFSKMSQRDIVTWNALISSCAVNGNDKEALDFFEKMQIEEIKPDAVTFVGILTACSHAGRLEDGWHYFVSISQDCGSSYSVEHYACMIDLFGRAGHLDKAEHLINIMPFEHGVSVWASLLGACKIHSDTERGIRAAHQLFDINPWDAASYVDLSNIYATESICDVTAHTLAL